MQQTHVVLKYLINCMTVTFSNNKFLSEQNDHRWNAFTGGILLRVEYFNRGREREYFHKEKCMDISTNPVGYRSSLELLAVTQVSTKSWTAHNPKFLTCLTIHASITSNTFACVLVNTICTCTAIVTGDTKAFIYICSARQHSVIFHW